MKLSWITAILFLFFSSSLIAQNNHETYQNKSIYLQTSFFGSKWVMNGQSKPLSLFDHSLENQLKKSTKATFLYKKYKSNRNTALILNIVGLASSLYGFQKMLKYNDSRNEQDVKTGVTFVSIGLGVTLVSIPFTFNSVNKLHKAIWQYNGDLMF